eukprot:TRINITY_DN3932_c0_g1_i1.p1 TRINITY_DN3932_c0_g1~~TRINITY_DN3932_c0_g1_i1.p1  ORF type:complete len:243 (+),score=74.29 TRINITY_DN3932_c0_g1_i1:36-731(+)
MQRVLFALGRSVREAGQALDRVGSRMQQNYGFTERLCRHQRLMTLYEKHPSVASGAFIAPNASVIGDVEVGENSTIWYGAVLRGDVNNIKVGDNSSIGDRVVVHVSQHNPRGPAPTVIGSNVVVENGAILHACTLEDGSYIGAGAIIYDGVVVEKGGIVEAGSIVTAGKRVGAGQVWSGNPAKHVRDVSSEESSRISASVNQIKSLADKHKHELEKTERQRKVEKILTDQI